MHMSGQIGLRGHRRSALRLQSGLVRVVTVALAVAGTSAAWVAPAHADEVRVLDGPATNDADVHLTYVS